MERMNADVVLVGASPIVLAHAVRLQREGRRTVVVEGRERIGGAWYVRPLWGIQNVEMGGYAWYRNDAAYRFVEGILGAPLVHVDPPPACIVRGMKIPFSMNEIFYQGKILLGHIKNLRRKRWRAPLGALRNEVPAALLRRPFRYPDGDCGRFVEALRDHLLDEGGLLLTGERILRADVDGGGPGVCRTTRREIEFNRLVMTSHSRLDLYREGREIPLEYVSKSATHFILLVEGRKRMDFSYLCIRMPGPINRVVDIGARLKGEDRRRLGDRLLLCVQLYEEMIDGKEEDEIARETTALLASEIPLLEAGARLLESTSERYVYDYLPPPVVDRVEEECSPAVRVLRTREFSDGMAEASR
jgi:hypothetical protein